MPAQSLGSNYVGSGARNIDRGRGYAAAKSYDYWVVTHQTDGSAVTSSTTLATTTPTFLLRNKSTSSKRVIPRRITLRQQGTVAGARITLSIVIDPTDRYSSGGTAILGQNTNTENVISTGKVAQALFYTGATATAEGTSDNLPRRIYNETLEAIITTPNNLWTYDFEDKVVLGKPGSLLVFTNAATTGATWGFSFDWIEES